MALAMFGCAPGALPGGGPPIGSGLSLAKELHAERSESGAEKKVRRGGALKPTTRCGFDKLRRNSFPPTRKRVDLMLANHKPMAVVI